MPTMIRKTFAVPPLGCNCSILGDPTTKHAVVVDPGGAPELILQHVRELGLTVMSVVHTHAHFDHFLASGEIQKATGARLCLHPDDRRLWEMLEVQCRMFGVPYTPVPLPDQWLQDDEQIIVGEVPGVALHTPGHTPGSMCFSFHPNSSCWPEIRCFAEASAERTSGVGMGRRFNAPSVSDSTCSTREHAWSQAMVPTHTLDLNESTIPSFALDYNRRFSRAGIECCEWG